MIIIILRRLDLYDLIKDMSVIFNEILVVQNAKTDYL